MTKNKFLVPPPFIFVFCAMLMKFIPPIVSFPIYWWAIVALGALALLISCWSIGQFLLARTSINPLQLEKSSQLVSNGIYRFTRNPMYLSLVLVLFGWNLYLGSVGALFGVVIFVGYMSKVQIRAEEQMLHKLFGEDYQRYCQRVRRWL